MQYTGDIAGMFLLFACLLLAMRAQPDAYTVEFILVLMFFFAVLHAILTYQLISVARPSLNSADRDGVRRSPGEREKINDLEVNVLGPLLGKAFG